MAIFSFVMFIAAILFLILGMLIFRGHVNLIHQYQQEKVKDKTAYGKAMGKPIMGIGFFAFLSGLVTFIPNVPIFLAIGIFIIGFLICFYFIYKAQKKFNDGLF